MPVRAGPLPVVIWLVVLFDVHVIFILVMLGAVFGDRTEPQGKSGSKLS